MPPLHHSTDERKAFGGDFNPNTSAVARYLLSHTKISFSECFSVIREACLAGVILYDSSINRHYGYNYKGPFPTTQTAGPGRLILAKKNLEKQQAKARRRAKQKLKPSPPPKPTGSKKSRNKQKKMRYLNSQLD